MAANVDDAFVVPVCVVMCCVGVPRAALIVVVVAVVRPAVQAKDGVAAAAVDASDVVGAADGVDDGDADGDADDADDGSVGGDDVCNVVANVRLGLLALQAAAAADNANFFQISTASAVDLLVVAPPQVSSVVLLRARLAFRRPVSV